LARSGLWIGRGGRWGSPGGAREGPEATSAKDMYMAATTMEGTEIRICRAREAFGDGGYGHHH